MNSLFDPAECAELLPRFPFEPNRFFGNMNGAEAGKDEWLTPPEILHALGEFDLDPCAPVVRPWETAKMHYTVNDNGLRQRWHGRVWLNPPYGPQTGTWLHKLAAHGNGIALVFARTETKAFFDCVWDKAHAVLFLRGRLSFRNVDGSVAPFAAGAPSCLIAYGDPNVESLRGSGINGRLIVLQ